jgi:hypothetical protein
MMGRQQEAPRVDGRRHERTAADARGPADAARRPRVPTAEAAILDLQRTAGNRGVEAALAAGGGATVQRQPTKGRKNDGGSLKLGGADEIPLQSATWSLKTTVAISQTGKSRTPTLHAASLTAGDLALKRRPDDRSDQIPELMANDYPTGTLRLDRPSKDGAIPAASINLQDVSLVSYSTGKGDDPTEILHLAVDWMKVSGMGKEERAGSKSKRARESPWELRATVGGDQLPAIPLITVEFSKGQLAGSEFAPGSLSTRTIKPPGQPSRATVTMGAGMALTRLAKAQSQNERIDIALVLEGDDRLRLQGAIVEKIESTDDGPDVVMVGFVAEESRFVPSAKAPGGAKTGGQAGASTR